ncbi:hypothetical protein [Arthrobacter sp. ISL-69]|nr:hypothetical protein [Arthrobacter sp. ISL-69]MBT2538825.1 hypothetical protein [Arthrobacter sp. ISL-69]
MNKKIYGSNSLWPDGIRNSKVQQRRVQQPRPYRSGFDTGRNITRGR